ncbi:tyrosine-type recombinase/integrase [Microvirga antarctica]|uniref:tyrosine-type recombinase/integrase n=1 Tax=Microvirga antarctica TaxID=2819233 RepID=UPI001B30F183|nr:site-specific integrase [Microvirga antarctica]
MAKINLKYVTGDVDRHGNSRWYFRRPGKRKIRLPGLPGSEEFMAVYKAALAGEAPVAQAPRLAKPSNGTLRWLCVEYFGSASFKDKLRSPRSRHVRRKILEKACETAGDELLGHITPKVIRKGMDRRADTPEAANSFLKAMRGLFEFAVEYEHARLNPTIGVKKLRSRNPEGWHAWTVDEVQQYECRHPIGTKARLALALLLYTGARRSDVVLLGRQHVRDGTMKFRVYKNRLRKHVEIEIPVLPELRAVIDSTSDKGDLAFLISDHGRPWANGDSFGNRFRDWCTEAGLPHCSPHGLRKAGASVAAGNGATESQLMAIYGWSDPKMAALYTRSANRKKLANDAMKLVVSSQTANETVPLSTPKNKSGTNKARKASKINED